MNLKNYSRASYRITSQIHTQKRNFLIISLLLVSCSSSDDNNDKPTVDDTVLILPQTEKYTSISHPEENNITTYTYNGNKIVSVDYSEGNKTTREKDGITVETTTYENTYNNNNFLTKQVSSGETFEYTYQPKNYLSTF